MTITYCFKYIQVKLIYSVSFLSIFVIVENYTFILNIVYIYFLKGGIMTEERYK